MQYENAVRAQFLRRPNRFVAQVLLEGREETVHVKNTGRCRELLLPGSEVVLCGSGNPARKTKYDLVSVFKEGLGWVNIDSMAPNRVVEEWLAEEPPLFRPVTLLKPEQVFDDSRIDFYLECGERRCFLEVKGCTLERDGVGYFPDAPTERGVKHLQELVRAAEAGFESYIAFVAAMPKVTRVLPNRETHPAFADALENAVAAGVKILYLPCEVSPDSLTVCGCSLCETVPLR